MASATVDITSFDNDMDDEEDLVFQSIPHENDKKKANIQTHKFTDFPNQAADYEEDEEDKTDLLRGERKQTSFWTFEYYQSFFDVNTMQVMRRIIGSMLPNPKSDYLNDTIRPNPDMYGPFWICTTLVFTTAIAGNMANYIQHSGMNYEWRYDFHKVTFAAAAIFSYAWIIPTVLYALLWWRKSQAGITFLEIICIYGYSLAIFIPISILWVIQYNWFQWILVVIGTLLSGSVLVLTFWPAVKDDDKKVAIATVCLIVLFHALLAIGFVLYFFHVPDTTPVSDITSTTTFETTTLVVKKLATNALPTKIPES